MRNRVLIACSATVGISLYFVYLVATVLFLQHLQISSVTLIESVIIITQIVRLAGIIAYYGSKPARIEVLLVLLSFETFIVMFLIILYLVAPNPAYSDLAHTIFSTWVAALFTVFPSYLIFAGVNQMLNMRSLILVLTSMTLEFGFLVFAASTMLAYSGSFTFGSFFDFLIGAARQDVASGLIPQLASLVILIPSVAVYCAMLIYATIPTSTSAVPPKVTFVLPFVAAAVALGWVYGAVYIAPNTLLSFTVPSVVIVALLWAYMRR